MQRSNWQLKDVFEVDSQKVTAGEQKSPRSAIGYAYQTGDWYNAHGSSSLVNVLL